MNFGINLNMGIGGQMGGMGMGMNIGIGIPGPMSVLNQMMQGMMGLTGGGCSQCQGMMPGMMGGMSGMMGGMPGMMGGMPGMQSFSPMMGNNVGNFLGCNGMGGQNQMMQMMMQMMQMMMQMMSQMMGGGNPMMAGMPGMMGGMPGMMGGMPGMMGGMPGMMGGMPGGSGAYASAGPNGAYAGAYGPGGGAQASAGPGGAQATAGAGKPVSGGQYDQIINEASQKYGVPAALIKAVVKNESNFNPKATSHCGAQGLMQLMPATARGLGCKNAYDPRQNIMAGAKYLSQLLKKYKGDTSKAVAAYNAGPGNVDKYGGVPPFKETQRYVPKVLASYQQYSQGMA